MSTALANRDQVKTLGAYLERCKPEFSRALPRHCDIGKFVRIAMNTVSKTPLLLECTKESIAQSVMTACALGLEPGGPLGGAYLVPYRTKRKDSNGNVVYVRECQLIPGYRGLIDLARRSGQIASISAHVVYEKDTFECEYGLEPKLVHKPTLDEDPGKPICAYAVAVLRDGSKQLELMSRAQIEAIRRRSKSSDDGPWVTDPDEMWRKTVVRRIAKYLPLSTELASALNLQAAAEDGDFEGVDLDVPSMTPIDVTVTEQPASGTQAVKERLKAGQQSTEETGAQG